MSCTGAVMEKQGKVRNLKLHPFYRSSEQSSVKCFPLLSTGKDKLSRKSDIMFTQDKRLGHHRKGGLSSGDHNSSSHLSALVFFVDIKY